MHIRRTFATAAVMSTLIGLPLAADWPVAEKIDLDAVYRIKEEGLPMDAYDWYLDLRKYGTFTHAGFGLGLERTVAWICGLPHIREASAFPRMMTRLRP